MHADIVSILCEAVTDRGFVFDVDTPPLVRVTAARTPRRGYSSGKSASAAGVSTRTIG